VGDELVFFDDFVDREKIKDYAKIMPGNGEFQRLGTERLSTGCKHRMSDVC